MPTRHFPEFLGCAPATGERPSLCQEPDSPINPHTVTSETYFRGDCNPDVTGSRPVISAQIPREPPSPERQKRFDAAPRPIATSGGSGRPTVTRYRDGSARIEDAGRHVTIPADAVAGVRAKLLELDAESRLSPVEYNPLRVTDDVQITTCGSDGAAVVTVGRGFAMQESVSIETVDLACVAAGLAPVECAE